jgi:cysteine-rich repeat protein
VHVTVRLRSLVEQDVSAMTTCPIGVDDVCAIGPVGDRTVGVTLAAGEEMFFIVNATALGPYTLELAASPCGNGLREPGEECEDGGRVSGDGCSAQCTYEDSLLEIEPNHEGLVSTGAGGPGVNDFGPEARARADLNGAIVADANVLGGLSPGGDEDTFAVRNASVAEVDVSFRTITFLNPCVLADLTNDTVLHVFDANGAEIGFNDDPDTATEKCAFIPVLPVRAGETVYVVVSQFNDIAAIDSYLLLVDFLP